jgi:uncharacterized protein (TIGR02594 family)
MPGYRVTASVLRIRSGPGTSYPIVGALNKDNTVQGDEINGDWVHVTSPDNKVGWSSRGFLELMDDTPQLPSQDSYRVDAASLNLRQGPGTSYPVVGRLSRNEVVESLAVSADGSWAQVRQASSATGWASLKYLTKVTPAPPHPPGDTLMIVTTDTLNVRAGPGTGYSLAGQVHRGEKVTFLGATPNWEWVNIQTSQKIIGWCSSRYLTEQTDLFAPLEDYPATGLHRALTDFLSMRETPDAGSKSVAELKFNRVVNVDSISADGKWKHCTNAWGESGWYPIERLTKLGEVAVQHSQEEFPYLPIAFAEYGTREVPGSASNPRIQEYIRSAADLAKFPNLPDETDWCSCFVNWCVEKAGLPSTESGLAASWKNWGVQPDSLRRGSVIVFRWDDGYGHVSFYLGDVGNYVICLGGNQSDAVWPAVYHKKYIFAYRVPKI